MYVIQMIQNVRLANKIKINANKTYSLTKNPNNENSIINKQIKIQIRKTKTNQYKLIKINKKEKNKIINYSIQIK